MMRPFGQHVDVLGQPHHRLHDVLDHHDGDAAVADGADHRHDVADLGRVEPGQHLVEQQQLRLGRERAGELEPLAGRDGEAGGRAIEQIGEPDVGSPTFSAAASASARARWRRWAPTAMLSRTDRPANGCTIWKVRAMPRRASRCGGRAGDVVAAVADRALRSAAGSR